MNRAIAYHTIRRTICLVLCGAALSFFSGCVASRPHLEDIQQWPDSDEQQRMSAHLKTRLQAAFPQNVNMIHRVVMTAAKRQFVFDGHLSIAADGTMRLIVMGPVGTIADFSANADGTITVTRHNPRFPERWVREYIARDLLLLFAAPDDRQLEAGLLADGTPALEMTTARNREMRRYGFDHAGEWTTLEVFRKSKPHYRAVCSRRRVFPGWERALPAAYSVKAGKYQLEVSIVTLQRNVE